VYRPKQGYSQLVLRTVSGSFRFVSGAQSPHHYEVQFPQGYLTVRGTTVDILSGRSRTVIILVEGSITVVPYATRIPRVLSAPSTVLVVYNDGHVDGPMTREAAITKLNLQVASSAGGPPQPDLIDVGQSVVSTPALALTRTAGGTPSLAQTPGWNWNGFYVGGNMGGGWGSVSSNYEATVLLIDPSASGSQSMSGAIGGIQAGYDWQSGNWVLGLETDFQLSSQTSYSVVGIDPVLATITDDHSVQLPWFGTVRARLGFTAANNWLVYATGGFAYGYIEENNTLNNPLIAASHSLIQGGWTVGGGIETALTNNWTANFEYLYIDFGDFNDTATSSNGFTAATISSHLTDNVVRVGLNYYFH